MSEPRSVQALIAELRQYVTTWVEPRVAETIGNHLDRLERVAAGAGDPQGTSGAGDRPAQQTSDEPSSSVPMTTEDFWRMSDARDRALGAGDPPAPLRFCIQGHGWRDGDFCPQCGRGETLSSERSRPPSIAECGAGDRPPAPSEAEIQALLARALPRERAILVARLDDPERLSHVEREDVMVILKEDWVQLMIWFAAARGAVRPTPRAAPSECQCVARTVLHESFCPCAGAASPAAAPPEEEPGTK